MTDVGQGRRVGVVPLHAGSGRQDLGLLFGELRLGEHALLFQFTQLFQLVESGGAAALGSGRSRSFLGRRRRFLFGPFFLLAVPDPSPTALAVPAIAAVRPIPLSSPGIFVSSQTASAASSAASMAWIGMRPLATS